MFDETSYIQSAASGISTMNAPNHSWLRRLCASIFVLWICCATHVLAAQVATADVLGTVTDSSGAVIPGATIRLENTGTHQIRTFTSAADGAYSFSLLQPGSYVLAISSGGFKKFQSTTIALAGSDRLRIDAKLVAGGTDETVEVTTQASALQTDSTNVGSTVTSSSIADLPLSGRNYVMLVQVQPGVNQGSANALNGGNSLNDRRASSSVSANGQTEVVNNQLLDGLDNNDRYLGNVLVRPSVEAIQEVRTDINLYTAEVGRTAGAAINVITKSGTNAYHGSVYEFFRNEVTDSRSYFAVPALIARKPVTRQSQFGFSLGGPIRRDRTLFFIDYEGFRRIDGTQSVYLASVPTLFEEQNPGNFSDIGQAVVPAAAIDPTALSYFRLYPAPNKNSTSAQGAQPVNNFISNSPVRQSQELGDGRIDHHFSANDTLFGRYSYNSNYAYTPPVFPAVNGAVAVGIPNYPTPGNTTTHVQNVQFDYIHIFTPSLLLELRTSYTEYSTEALPPNYGNYLNNTAMYKIPNANDCGICSGLATINIPGYSTLGDDFAAPLTEYVENYQYGGGVTYTHGQHAFKFGSALIRRHFSLLQASQKAYITFGSLSSFLSGTPYTYSRQLVLAKPYERSWEPSFYAQDDWHASRSLTLNYGARYDVFTPASEKYGRNTTFNLATLQEVENQTGGINTSYVNIAPRIGIAATVGKGLVIRGGFGLSFYPSDTVKGLILNNAPQAFNSGAIQVPTTTTLSVNGVIPSVAQSTAQASLRGTVVGKPSNFRDAYVEQFNVLIQKEFSGNVFTVGYVGELGHREEAFLPNVNNPLPAGPVAPNTPPPTQIYAATLPNVTAIAYISDQGSASYHSFQSSLERRLYKGLVVNLNYTHSHALDDVFTGAGANDSSYGLEPSNYKVYDYGNSLIDVANRFAGTFVYDLPFGKSGSALYRKVVSDFRINGLGFWQTGLPVPITSTVLQNGRATINLVGITTDRPDKVGQVYAGSTGGAGTFFNPGAFARQALGTAGNAGRDQVRGPDFRRGDLSLVKGFAIYERVTGQLRVECFNITNTPNFGQPNSNIAAYSTTPDANGRFEATSAGGFGSISSTLPGTSGRQFQFALKLLF